MDFRLRIRPGDWSGICATFVRRKAAHNQRWAAFRWTVGIDLWLWPSERRCHSEHLRRTIL